MGVNIVALVCLGLVGFVTKKTIGFNVNAFMSDAALTTVIFVVIVPVAVFMLSNIESGSIKAGELDSFIDSYVEHVAGFIQQQTPGWVAGYVAAYVVASILAVFR